MATKVKPSRLQVSGTAQVGQVPVYVDEDTFQWGAGGGGGNVKSFTLSSTSDLTTAQEAYDWYDDGNVAIIVYNDKEYLFDYATAGNAYWSVANEEAYDTVSGTGMRKASLQLALSSGTVTGVTALNISVNDFNVLRTDKDYGTPYTPQYNGSPATKKYVDDSVSTLMGLGKFLSLWDATTGQPISFPLSTPYTYSTGDYYLVETVSSATPPVNYKPTGSSYTGTASSTTESEELEVGDIYIYDGTTWLLQLNHGKTISFSEIAGDPYDNTNLSNALSAKANDSAVVKLTGNQTIAGTKTFSTSPVVPSKTAAATNTGTAIATEAQVYAKQDKLTTQTAYTTKGTSTKVPTITTNTLGQVTAITETSIAFPVTSVNGSTGAVVLDADDISDSTTTNKFVTQTDKDSWDSKQDELESGVNIRTINGTSILGSGNIDTPTGIPSQTGEAGKFLTTDGTSVSWGTPTGGGIQLAPNTELNIKYHWYGSQSSYDGLSQYYTDTAGDTAYFTVA